MMNKKILLSVVLVLGLACVGYLIFAMHKTSQASGVKQAAMPPGYDSIRVGVSETQVLSLVGQPFMKSHYARYEKKPPSYWEALKKQASATDPSQPAYNGAPNMAAIRAATLLTHQYCDVWQYKPVPSTMLTLYFNDQGTLLNMGTSSAGNPGGARSSAPPKRG